MKQTHNPLVLGSSPSRPTGEDSLSGQGFQPARTHSGFARFARFQGAIVGQLVASLRQIGLLCTWIDVFYAPVSRTGVAIFFRVGEHGGRAWSPAAATIAGRVAH